MSTDPTKNSTKTSAGRQGPALRWLVSDRFWFTLFALVMAALIFRHYMLQSDPVRLTTDDSLGAITFIKNMLPKGIAGAWNETRWLGAEEVILPGWTNFWLWLLPRRVFVNHIYPLSLVMGSIFFGLFLAQRGCRLPAVVLGILTAFWLGNNLTIGFPGHMGKFGLMMACALFLWLTDKAASNGSWAWLILAGGAMGLMPVEQRDMALFAWLIFPPYAVYAIWRDAPNRRISYIIGRLAVMLGVTLLIAVHVAAVGYRENFSPGSKSDFKNAGEQFAFATQWSWPPEESIDFIAPGYTGWRSHDTEGPYWGRLGQDADWKDKGTGFRNFKHESAYIGVIPICFALLAVVAAIFHRPGKTARDPFATLHAIHPHWQMDILFWSIMATISLLLAFGKFFPLYTFIHKLPVINAIRNPNKFLQCFQLIVAILTAHGLTLAITSGNPSTIGLRARIATLANRQPKQTVNEEP
jgi:hypothetical protein